MASLTDGTDAFIPEGWKSGSHRTDKNVLFPYIRHQKDSDWAEVNWIDRGCLLPASKAVANDAQKWAEHFHGNILGTREGDVVIYDLTYQLKDNQRDAFAQLVYKMPDGPRGHKLTVAHLLTVNPQVYPFWQLRALALSRK